MQALQVAFWRLPNEKPKILYDNLVTMSTRNFVIMPNNLLLEESLKEFEEKTVCFENGRETFISFFGEMW